MQAAQEASMRRAGSGSPDPGPAAQTEAGATPHSGSTGPAAVDLPQGGATAWTAAPRLDGPSLRPCDSPLRMGAGGRARPRRPPKAGPNFLRPPATGPLGPGWAAAREAPRRP